MVFLVQRGMHSPLKAYARGAGAGETLLRRVSFVREECQFARSPCCPCSGNATFSKSAIFFPRASRFTRLHSAPVLISFHPLATPSLTVTRCHF